MESESFGVTEFSGLAVGRGYLRSRLFGSLRRAANSALGQEPNSGLFTRRPSEAMGSVSGFGVGSKGQSYIEVRSGLVRPVGFATRSVLLFGLVIGWMLGSVAFGQSEAQKAGASKPEMQKAETKKPAAPKTEAQKSFEQLKGLAGTWHGNVTITPPQPDMDGKEVKATLRVTSMGNALMHEMTGADRPDDPITMLYLDGDRLLLTHYCDAGNRPRMTGKMSADGKSIEFEFLDVAGSTQYGHMHGAKFTPVDADHHTEDWVFMKGDTPLHAHMELERSK